MAKIESRYQGVKGVYFIVNPAGAVHSCDKDHARTRLQVVGWRLADDGEIERYQEQDIQRADAPIAPRWSPEPDVETILPPAQIVPDGILATEKALELAKEKGLDLATVQGTGTDGRVLVKDVEAALASKA